ncbi:MAG: aminoacyl-tRNA hydrolase [Candidatus Magasanikbacteria bacterium]|nr:aminoacyl-tRNA hydrolase [Candidatus Magasanikbacteria bacterium]
MKLIVGLGNPGKKYARTRHNAGFMALDAAREALLPHQVSAWELSKKFNAEICGCTVRGGEKVILAKPMTFMNVSGEAVQLLGHFYKLTPRDLLVVHDDKDLPLGECRRQTDRGSAGHQGVISIIEHIGTQDFTRLRLGIASDNPKRMANVPKFVLSNFGLLERKKVGAMCARAAQEILQFLLVT